MLVVRSETHRSHHCLELDSGVLVPSWDSPDRADLIANALAIAKHDFGQPDALDRNLLASVHSSEYIEFLNSAWTRWEAESNSGPAAMAFTWPARGMENVRPQSLSGQLGFHSFAADCSIVAGTWTAAADAAAIAQTVADRVSDGLSVAYGLCRPPGHHATVDQFGGYCYLNNAAVAAQRLLDKGAARVAILDVDYHHGNGTQAIFYQRRDVLFISIHADPRVEFPFFAGHTGESGAGAGEGFNLNLPLPHGTAIAGWLEALETGLSHIRSTGVDAIVVSLGVDTFHGDPISQFKLDSADYPVIAERIGALNLPMVIVQEGGYAVDAIGTNVASFLDPLG